MSGICLLGVGVFDELVSLLDFRVGSAFARVELGSLSLDLRVGMLNRARVREGNEVGDLFAQIRQRLGYVLLNVVR